MMKTKTPPLNGVQPMADICNRLLRQNGESRRRMITAAREDYLHACKDNRKPDRFLSYKQVFSITLLASSLLMP